MFWTLSKFLQVFLALSFQLAYGHVIQLDFKCFFTNTSEIFGVIQLVSNMERALYYNSSLKETAIESPFGKALMASPAVKKGIPLLPPNMMAICETNRALMHLLQEQAYPPSVKITEAKHSQERQRTLLTCHADGFYPPFIKMDWLKNGQVHTVDVLSSGILSNGDLTYQIQKFIEITPDTGDRYSCKVEHEALNETIVEVWNTKTSLSEKQKIIIGAVGTGIGILFFMIGLIARIIMNRGTARLTYTCVLYNNQETDN
ncbi:class II histocompatibility antigen, B-L beta chain-like [Protopterus annectens]|uniref:class II histocompatibility antigen, B-L beta chain-like n=1 Tax=Protopterus annectens TaxID=7888 RepID=UPI001CFA2ED0|nr:class II histocompatibility antigen, B-L beta chain-like [Protopterus annectens]